MSESARSRLVRAVAGVSPLLVLAVTLGGLVVALDRSHAEFAIYVLLFVSTIGLAMSGMSLSRTFFTFPKAWPFLAGSRSCVLVGLGNDMCTCRLCRTIFWSMDTSSSPPARAFAYYSSKALSPPSPLFCSPT